MGLKLAEYKDGKFLSFLELGKDFGYFKDYIQLTKTPVGTMRLNQFVNMAARNTETDKDATRWVDWALSCLIDKDKTDPLNRFDGLFDGRTYGEGRFVLEIDEQDTYVDTNDAYYKMAHFIASIGRRPNTFKIINLHESPELFKELSNE